MDSVLQHNYTRKFGVEIELNAFDGRAEIQIHEQPMGIQYIASLISNHLEDYVEIQPWNPTVWHDTNGFWLVKPDASCGMEVCTPIMKGWTGLREVCQVVELLSKNPRIEADRRCSLHVHIDVSDCSNYDIANILRFWIKFEPVFMDAMPDQRKRSRYCQYIGMWDWMNTDRVITPNDLIELLGKNKYFSVNSYHLYKKNRQTIEFRIGEAEMCRNPFAVKNWVRLLIHFVEVFKNTKSSYYQYVEGDVWSSFLFLDVDDLMAMLFPGELSPGLQQVRNWFLARMVMHIVSDLKGVYNGNARRANIKKLLKITEECKSQGVDFEDAINPVDLSKSLYSNIYAV